MYCLSVIKSESFQNPPRIKDNSNRDCSLLKSRGGFVAHSAVHRSTHFADKSEHAETYCLYWRVADHGNQSAVNAAVEAIEAGASVPAAWRAALQAAFPGVKVHGGDTVRHAAVPIRADVPSGRLTLRVSAGSFPELLCALTKLQK